MKIGIVIGTNEAEVVWNAFRLANLSLESGYSAKIFLINSGSELEDISDDKYDIKELIDYFIRNKGQILACGTCLKSRNKEGSDVCPISTMKDLLKMIEESDKILTFG